MAFFFPSKLLRALLLVALGTASSGKPARVAATAQPEEIPHSALHNSQSVKVHLVTQKITKELALEDYLRGVLAAEASVEDQREALKAQAVVSRTFALRNRGRHAREGYDFCSTTHCQRFVLKGVQAAQRALIETRGEVLAAGGEPIDAYFHAACGGMTADITALWGVAAPPYLRGVRDDYCAAMPHRQWTQVIAALTLAQALRSDERTDVGAWLNSIVVVKRDASGRAETIALEGERRRLVRGWDFKLIVGRSLGWQMVKSSRFAVQRIGDKFIFRGSGFGHGLGLCQEGAHVMARRGLSYRRILAHYLPGATLQQAVARVLPASFTPAQQRASLASEHFRASYPAGTDRRAVEKALRVLEIARGDLLRRLAQASFSLAETAPFELIIHATTPDFIAATGQSGWVAAVAKGRRIEVQSLALLERRGILATTLRHELTHAVIETLAQGRAPRWLAEGLAIYVAGEGRRLGTAPEISLADLENKLARPTAAAETKSLYAAAYREVLKLLRAEGEAGVWRRVAESGKRKL